LEQPPADDPHSALLVQIQGAVAEYERAKLTERYRRGKLYRARQGEVFWSSIPYGYRRVPRRDGSPAHLLIDEAQADVVRQIFRWHVEQGMSIRQITKRLSQQGYPVPRGGPRWGETTVHRILRREAYLGTLYYNQCAWVAAPASEGAGNKRILRPASEWIGVSIPPLIDRETFQRSQARHAPNQQFSPRNLRQERWLLRRLVRCDKCGLKCASVADRARPHRPSIAYYRCDKQERVMGRERCGPNHIRAEPLDTLVWNEVRSHLLQPALLVKAQSVFAESTSLDQSFLSMQINHVRKRLVQVKAEQRRLLDAFQGGFIEQKEFESRSVHIGSRLSQLQADLQSLEQEYQRTNAGEKLTARLREFTSAVTHKLDTMTFHEKQGLVRTVLEEVVIHDNVVKLYFKIPLPRSEPDPPPREKPRRPPALSSELHLRSRSGQHVDVRVECQQITEGLHEQDHPRTALHCGAGVGVDQQSLHDMTQLPEQCAPAREDRPKHPGYGEDVLPVRNGRENVFLDPIPIGKHALLVTARAEIASLAGKREQVVVTAFGAIDPRESVLRISAFHESLDDAFFEQPLQASLGSQLCEVAIGALVKRARARAARPIHTACWRFPHRSRTWLAASGHDANNAVTGRSA
jgi:site-specific DNA recombinase